MTVTPPTHRDAYTGQPMNIPVLRLGTVQTANVTTSASIVITNTVGGQTEVICCVSTVDCHVDIGESPSANITTKFFLPALTPMYFGVRPGVDKVAGTGRSASGILFVSEFS